MKQTIVDTSYGEVKVIEGMDGCVDCYNGDNFDEYIGTIEGNVQDDADELADKIEEMLF